MRKLTDEKNPDFTFSDPKFVQANEDIKSCERNSIPVTKNHPFAGIGAQDGTEVEATESIKIRKYTSEAHFGGSGSEKGGYTDDEEEDSGKVKDDVLESGTDDDEESMH